MDYTKIYNDLMNSRKGRMVEGYREIHHIIPRSMGGSDDRGNLIPLTTREHYIAHWLLSRVHRNTPHHPMHFAFSLMTHTTSHRMTSRKFALAREALGLARRNKETSVEARELQELAAMNRSPAFNLPCRVKQGCNDEFLIPCLYGFCKEQEVPCSNAMKAYRGERRSVKGYMILPEQSTAIFPSKIKHAKNGWTATEVDFIKHWLSNGSTLGELAETHKVSKDAISDIKRGKTSGVGYRGTKGSTKLSDDQLAEIVSLKDEKSITYREIADRYSVCYSTISIV